MKMDCVCTEVRNPFREARYHTAYYTQPPQQPPQLAVGAGSSVGDALPHGPYEVRVLAETCEQADSSDQIRFLGIAVLDAKCAHLVDSDQALALGRWAPA